MLPAWSTTVWVPVSSVAAVSVSTLSVDSEAATVSVAAVTPLSEVFSVPEAALLPQAASCSTMAAVNNAAVSFVFFIIVPPSEMYQYVIIG